MAKPLALPLIEDRSPAETPQPIGGLGGPLER